MNPEYDNEIEQVKRKIDELAIPLIVNRWEEAETKLNLLLPPLKEALQKLLMVEAINEEEKLVQEQMMQVLDNILKAWQGKDCIQLSDLLQYDLYNIFDYYLKKKSGDKE